MYMYIYVYTYIYTYTYIHIYIYHANTPLFVFFSQYEESIFRAEDERFELDTAIETNMSTLTYLLPLAADIAAMTEPEVRKLDRRGVNPTHRATDRHRRGAHSTRGTQPPTVSG